MREESGMWAMVGWLILPRNAVFQVSCVAPSPASHERQVKAANECRFPLCLGLSDKDLDATERLSVNCHCFGVISQIWGQMARKHLVIINLIFTFLLLELGSNPNGILQNVSPGQFREGYLLKQRR